MSNKSADDVLDDWLTDDQIKNANSLFLPDLLGLMEMQDEELQMPAAGWDNHKAVERSVGRNQAREELRKAMTIYFMGTVGGDDGDSK